MYYKIVRFLLEEEQNADPWYMKILKDIGKQVSELVKEFADFFGMIKRNTFDVLVDKFGYTGVMLTLSVVAIVAIMLVATGIIRGKD